MHESDLFFAYSFGFTHLCHNSEMDTEKEGIVSLCDSPNPVEMVSSVAVTVFVCTAGFLF